ncbi:preprotein translocase subunit SecE [Gordonia rhizosphera]|uniref:Protein translocase subunit SecE n=1 Tax=Gordonia rhizosphera NBRC 16068 TaxID=1108045 RepID=K6VQD3_9ACTN|nr:preprotein translocase subunit SecE [Gordonia rhizosphera]GAB89125.1 preprotein translocase SecE subunit [Gordonia rhizosphera NBRC 16068]
MSKRDRARDKDAAEDISTESAEELEGREDATSSDEESTELRPSGKRSARGRRSSTSAPVTDGDSDSEGGSAVAVKERKKKPASESRNPLVRIWLFLKQVVAELKKVIWPTRSEMITYTIVVLIFVIVMTAFISGIDLGFAKLVLLVFG